MKQRNAGFFVVALMVFAQLMGCGRTEDKSNEVIIYTAVEQEYCEPIFEEFEKESGIKVKAVYDTEANKTTGLVNRIISERKHPVCDVFWNNEFIQTLSLQDKNLLDSYVSDKSKDIPGTFKDENGYWTAIGGRARVMLVNCALLSSEDYPESIYNFADGSFKGDELALAYPAFGTTKTQVAAMYALLGEDKAKAFYQAIKDQGVQIVDGNSVTKDMVVAGQVKIGYTDTDDAKEAISDGHNVEIIYPDQGENGIGTLITPSTVALIHDAPNSENAKKLIDYLISKEREQQLIESGFFDVSVRESGAGSFNVKGMDLSLREIYEMLDVAANDMEEIFTNAER